MSDDALIQAALSVWPFNDEKPVDIGVEAGIVWATVRGPLYGINGYALIPAEGHVWSKDWPNGISQTKDIERSNKGLKKFMELTRAGSSFDEAAVEATQDFTDEDYLDSYLEVHGGVTYYHHPWIGFDTKHLGDYWPREWHRRDYDGRPEDNGAIGDRERLWTPELVVEESKRLAQQVAEIGRR